MDGQPFGKNKLRVQRCVRQTKTSTDNQQAKSWSGSIGECPLY